MPQQRRKEKKKSNIRISIYHKNASFKITNVNTNRQLNAIQCVPGYWSNNNRPEKREIIISDLNDIFWRKMHRFSHPTNPYLFGPLSEGLSSNIFLTFMP